MGRTQIYIPENEENTFKKTKEEIRQLWYKKYGEAIPFSTVIIKSLILFRDFLKDPKSIDTYDNKRKDIYKYERIRK